MFVFCMYRFSLLTKLYSCIKNNAFRNAKHSFLKCCLTKLKHECIHCDLEGKVMVKKGSLLLVLCYQIQMSFLKEGKIC